MREIVFMGIFDKIASWIMSGISKAITWLVSNIIAPVCSVIWENALKYVVSFIYDVIAEFFYRIYALLLTILYGIEMSVYSFAGVRNIYTYENGKSSQTQNFFDLVFNQSAIDKAFWYITAISVTLLFVFTVFSVMRASFDFGFDGKTSVGHVLTNFFRGAITILILPVLCYGLVQLTSVCTTQLYKAVGQAAANDSTDSQTIYLTDTLYLLSASSKSGSGTDDVDYSGLARYIRTTGMGWYNLADVKPYLKKASNIDFLLGIIGAVLLIMHLLAICAVFIQRVLEVCILYIVSPFFAATMPLDDGERYQKWRRTFVGRLFMGVGMVVALNIAMMMISLIISGSGDVKIRFTENVSLTDNTVQSAVNDSIDILLKLLFMLGAIISVKSMGFMLTSLIDEDTARSEERTTQTVNEKLKEYTRKAAQLAVMAGTGLAGAGAGAKGAGEPMTASQQGFADKLRSTNASNSRQAFFTKRGAKYSAYKNAKKSGEDALRQFGSLRTNEQREAFIKRFNAEGGFDKLNVRADKFGSSEMTSGKERGAVKNLDRRIDRAREARNACSIGSQAWKNADAQLSRLESVKAQFDMLDTHRQREAFIKNHSNEMGDFKRRTPSELLADSRMNDNIKRAREKMQGSAPNSKAYNDAKASLERFTKAKSDFATLSSHEERKAFILSHGEAAGKGVYIDGGLPMNEKELDFAQKLEGEKSKNNAKRHSARRGAAKTKYKENAEKASADFESFSKLETHEQREEFMKSYNMDDVSAANVKDSSDRNSFSENRAAARLKANKAALVRARDASAEGSDKRELYNAEIESLNSLEQKFDTLSTHKEREDFIKQHDYAFADADYDSRSSRKGIKRLDENIKATMMARDMSPKGSATWNRANKKLDGLMETRAEYLTLKSDKERNTFVSEHSGFENMEDDKNITVLNGAISSWAEIERTAADSGTAQHARAMKQSYQSLLSDYISQGNTGKKNTMELVRKSESASEACGGIPLTPTELSRFESVKFVDNSRVTESYLSAQSHEERDRIFTQVQSGQIARLEAPDRREGVYLQQLDSAIESASALAENPDTSPEQKQQSENVVKVCRAAKETYASLRTHSQREEFAFHASSVIENSSDGLDIEVPKMQAPEIMETERTIFEKISSNEDAIGKFNECRTHRERYDCLDSFNMTGDDILQMNDSEYGYMMEYMNGSADTEYEKTARYRSAFISASSHEERQQVVKDYSAYVISCDASARPHNWNASEQTEAFDDAVADIIAQSLAEPAASVQTPTQGGHTTRSERTHYTATQSATSGVSAQFTTNIPQHDTTVPVQEINLTEDIGNEAASTSEQAPQEQQGEPSSARDARATQVGNIVAEHNTALSGRRSRKYNGRLNRNTSDGGRDKN